MKGIEAIIFDVDGVLVRVVDESGNFLWKKDIEADLGIPMGTIESFFRLYWQDISVGNIDTLDALAEHLRGSDLDISAQTVLDYWHRKDSNIDQHMHV